MTVNNKLITLTEGIESYYRDEEYHLLPKLRRFMDTFPDNIKNYLQEKVENLDDWLKSIKNTRVFIAHGDKKEDVIDDFHKLSVYVNVLQNLEQFFILKQLGMNDLDSSKLLSRIIQDFDSEQI